MARCLIVGCGCRGLALASLLRESGHAVRGTTRDPGRLLAIEAAGAEATLADPDRLGTLLPALEQVAVVILPLGSAAGTVELVSALHGARLEALLAKLVDTPVRGVVYETTGTVEQGVLDRGAELVVSACSRSRIPHELIPGAGGPPSRWPQAAAAAVARLLRAG